jgi:uncharacterized protein
MIKPIPQAVVEALGHYVYRLLDPRDGKTFYVGKGVGQRVLQHEWDALEGTIPAERLQQIRNIHTSGHHVRLIIHRHGLDENTAKHVEASLIDVFPNLLNLVRGHDADLGVAELENLIERYDAKKAEIHVKGVLIRIEREWRRDLSPEELYEKTRGWWACQPKRHNPDYAFSVALGLIREVFQIEKWERYNTRRNAPHDSGNLDARERQQRDQNRVGFIGKVSESLQYLKGASVAHLLPRGAANPIRYVNC